MSLIASALSVIGILFVVRTLSVFRARALVPDVAVNSLGVMLLACFGLVSFFAPFESFGRALCASVVAIASPFILFTLERRRITAFKARVPLFLDRWILNLRLGASVTAARDQALRDEDADVRALLRPVFDARIGECRSHLFLPPAVLRELDHVGRAAHSALERLEAVRAGIRETAEFRRKSGHAVRQAAIQSSIMVVMLIALSVFTIRRYGWAQSGGFVTAAAMLSLIGAALMVHLSRKTKWNL